MKFKNTTNYSDRFLRKMLSFCCKELGVPMQRRSKIRPRLVKVTFGNRTYGHASGRAWAGGEILVRMGPDKGYPFNWKYPNRVRAPECVIVDRLEALIHVTAHEVAHLARWQHSGKHREARVDRMALDVLEKFRAQRDELFQEWSKETKVSVKLSIVDQRALKVEKMLRTWERKLKLATTKVKQWRRKQRYYQQKGEAACPEQ